MHFCQLILACPIGALSRHIAVTPSKSPHEAGGTILDSSENPNTNEPSRSAPIHHVPFSDITSILGYQAKQEGAPRLVF